MTISYKYLPTNMNAVFILITPELASMWMEGNTSNRNKKLTKIKQYARDMQSSRWLPTGETIKIAENGRLLDGQNRLQACIDSNAPFPSWVIFNVPTEAFMAIDTGAKRSTSDVLTIVGEDNTVIMSAVLKCVYVYLHGKMMPRISNVMNPTPHDLLDLLHEFPELQDSAAFAAKFGNLRTPMTVLHFLGSKLDKRVTENFMEKVHTGAGLEANSPGLLLRERLFDRVAGVRGGHNSETGYRLALAIKALNAEISGAKRVQLAWRWSSGEKFPVLKGDTLYGSRVIEQGS